MSQIIKIPKKDIKNTNNRKSPLTNEISIPNNLYITKNKIAKRIIKAGVIDRVQIDVSRNEPR